MINSLFKSILSSFLIILIVIGIFHSTAASDIMTIPSPPVPTGAENPKYSIDFLSGNGLVVAGIQEYYKDFDHFNPDDGEYYGLFLWTKEHGFKFFLEETEDTGIKYRTTGLSYYGSAVGYRHNWRTMGGYWYTSFRFSDQYGLQWLGNDNIIYQKVSDISADGSVVVGWSSYSAHPWAGIFIWKESTGPAEILPPTDCTFSSIDAPVVSGDGQTVIVNCEDTVIDDNQLFYKWTESGGYEWLGNGTVADISADANVIIGTTPGGQAFRYTDANGIEVIGNFSPRKTNEDGSLVIGENHIWDEQNGLQSINDYFTLNGIELNADGWTLYSVKDVSDDGNVFIGTGINNLTTTEIPWIATIDANHPPLLDPIGSKSLNVNELLEFTITASDPDGDAVSFTASNLPTGASFDPANQEFKWTPVSGDEGNYNVMFTVTDHGSPPLSDSETITITVGNVNRPPVLDPIGAKSLNVNELLEFTITASDPDGDAVSCTATNLPSGASFDADNLKFSWTPGSGDEGNYNVMFTVTDHGSPPLSDSETISVKVDAIITPDDTPNVDNSDDEGGSGGCFFTIITTF